MKCLLLGFCLFFYLSVILAKPKQYCPIDRDVVEGLNLTMLSGKWYEIKRLGNPENNPPEHDCVIVNYEIIDSEHLKINQTIQRLPNKTLTYTYGEVNVTFPNEYPLPGILTASFDGNTILFYILDTDYDNYLIMYHCTDLGDTLIENAWIYSREKYLNDESQQKVDEIIKKYFSSNQFRLTNHSNDVCEYN